MTGGAPSTWGTRPVMSWRRYLETVRDPRAASREERSSGVRRRVTTEDFFMGGIVIRGACITMGLGGER